MAFREVRVFEVREVLRLCLAGEGLRSVERLTQVDRKTVRRYVTAAARLVLVRDGGDEQLCDVWQLLSAEHERIAGWVKDDLTGVKIHDPSVSRAV